MKNYYDQDINNEIYDKYDQSDEQILNDVEKLSKNTYFYNLPLKSILSTLSKVHFNSIQENENRLEVICDIIQNTINSHHEEKETLLLLHFLDFSSLSLSFAESFSILDLFKNCPFLCNLVNLYKEQYNGPDFDYEYEIQLREKEIEKLKTKYQKYDDFCIKYFQKYLTNFTEIDQKPSDYEPNIFLACKEGKLTSVQWQIEKEGVDPSIRIVEKDRQNSFYQNDSLLHVAAQWGHINIVQYLIERQNIDINIIGYGNWTPLYTACYYNNENIIAYLVYHGADKSIQSNCAKTPYNVIDPKYRKILNYSAEEW